MPGRVRKPQGLRDAEGSRPRHPRNDSVSPSRVPPPPENLTELEKAVWRDLARAVEMVGTYDLAAHDPFVVFVRLGAAVRGFDFTQMSTAMGNTLRQYISMCSRFGVTPSDRSKVPTLSKPSTGSGDDEFTSPGTPVALHAVPAAGEVPPEYVAPTLDEVRAKKRQPTPLWLTNHRLECTNPECGCRIRKPWEEDSDAAAPTAPTSPPAAEATDELTRKATAVGSSPGPKAGQSSPEGLASGPLTLPTE